MAPLISDGDRQSSLAPTAMGCAIAAIMSIAIGPYGLPLN